MTFARSLRRAKALLIYRQTVQLLLRAPQDRKHRPYRGIEVDNALPAEQVDV